MSNPQSEALAKMSDEQISSIYKTVFSTPDGKLVLQDIMERSYREGSPAIENDGSLVKDANRLFLNAGMELVCIHIESRLNYKPETQKEFSHD